MQITPLTLEHEAALGRFLADFAAGGEATIPGWFLADFVPHADKVAALASQSLGTDLPEGWVPCTTRFLEHEGELLGVSNFRHRLNPNLERFGGHVGYSVRPSARRQGHGRRLLAAAMDFGRELGLESLLVTCDPGNLGSIGVITGNGGVLTDRYYHPPEDREVCRFRVSL